MFIFNVQARAKAALARIQIFIAVIMLWVEPRVRSLAIGAAIMAIGLIALWPSGMASADSTFSIDLSGLLTTASQLFNGLFPVFGPIIGITLAFGIIGFIIAEIRRAI